MSEWISVKDRLPEKESRYWIVASDFFIGGSGIGIYENNEWLTLRRHHTILVDYWMPVPPPPQY